MPLAVVAVGGNSLIKDKMHQTVPDQYMAAVETMRHVANMVERGWDVVITHGNGPQVGFILLRAELAKKVGMHDVPLDSCGADTQGAIGYFFQQILENEFLRRDIDKEAVTVVTRVMVDKDDPAFKKPSKPIGPFMNKDDAVKKEKEEGWDIVEDAGRGYRRVVSSPRPLKIIEQKAIESLVRDRFVVVAVGGGGIPVYKRDDGLFAGIEAVIDKDLASALLATEMKADLLLISTAVDKVCLNFGTCDQKEIEKMSAEEAQKYCEEGHFAAGSMLPKVQAAVEYLRKGGKKAIITSPSMIELSLDEKAGTCITV
jgi:carbamate kinase